MTPQEISKFVNQPIPRKVPYKVFCKVTCWLSRYNYYSALLAPFIGTLFITYMFMRFSNPFFMMDYILLDFGIGNKMTMQGNIVSITPQRLSQFFMRGIGPTFYNVRISFHDDERYRHINSFVWRRKNIPGWGIIPETQNNPDFSIRRSILATPFPVIVEYIPNRSYAVRAVGTRSYASLRVQRLIWIFVELYLLSRILLFILDSIPKIKRLLRKGLFATGYISKQNTSNGVLDYVVSFTDQRGVMRVAPIIMTPEVLGMPWLPDWVDRGLPVGLLYLPDTKAVIVLDLWLDYCEFSSSGKNPNSNYEKEKAAYLERIKNMTQKEAKAGFGVLERWMGKLYDREYIPFVTILIFFLLGLISGLL